MLILAARMVNTIHFVTKEKFLKKQIQIEVKEKSIKIRAKVSNSG